MAGDAVTAAITSAIASRGRRFDIAAFTWEKHLINEFSRAGLSPNLNENLNAGVMVMRCNAA
jgi:hypothetical protein